MDLSLPVEFNKQKIDGRYRLVVAVAQRAKELYQGAQSHVSSKAKKITTVALEEILSDALNILTDKAAVKAKAEASRLTHEDIMDEAEQKGIVPEDLTELEKDIKVYLHKKGEKKNKETIEGVFSDKGS